MCGPSIPGEPSQIARTAGPRRGIGRFAGGRASIGVPLPVPLTEAEKAEATALERSRKVKSGGRQGTILAGGGVARETRRASLLAASEAEQQRKTLLGQ